MAGERGGAGGAGRAGGGAAARVRAGGERAEILAGVLAGIELGAWDRRIAEWLAGLGHGHCADCRVVDRAVADGAGGSGDPRRAAPG